MDEALFPALETERLLNERERERETESVCFISWSCGDCVRGDQEDKHGRVECS